MKTALRCLVLLGLSLALAVAPGASADDPPKSTKDQNGTPSEKAGESHREENALNVHYLEIVTTTVTETCDALEKMHDVAFGDAVPELGNARTADLEGGGRIAVRAPMGPTEEPVVRPYALVDDVHAATKIAEEAGALVALPPTEIPGQGTFSIFILGGIQHGLWQL